MKMYTTSRIGAWILARDNTGNEVKHPSISIISGVEQTYLSQSQNWVGFVYRFHGFEIPRTRTQPLEFHLELTGNPIFMLYRAMLHA